MKAIEEEFKGKKVSDIRSYIIDNNWPLGKAKTRKDLLKVIEENRIIKLKPSKSIRRSSRLNNKDDDLVHIPYYSTTSKPKVKVKPKNKSTSFSFKRASNSKSSSKSSSITHKEPDVITKNPPRSSFKREGRREGTKTIMFSTPNDTFLPGISTLLNIDELRVLRGLIDKRRDNKIEFINKYIVSDNKPIYLDSRDLKSLEITELSKFIMQPGTKYVIFEYEDMTIGNYPLWEWISLNNKPLCYQLLEYWGINHNNIYKHTIVEFFVLLTYCDSINYDAMASPSELKVVSTLTLEEMSIVANYDHVLKYSTVLMSLLTGTILNPTHIQKDKDNKLSIETCIAMTRSVYLNQELFDLIDDADEIEYYDLASPIYIYETSQLTKNVYFLSLLDPDVYTPSIISINMILSSFKMVPHPSKFTLKHHDYYFRESYIDYNDVIISKNISKNVNRIYPKIKNRNIYSDVAYLEIIPLSAKKVYNNRRELLDYIYHEGIAESDLSSSSGLNHLKPHNIKNKWVLPVYQCDNNTELYTNPHFINYKLRDTCISLDNILFREVDLDTYIYVALTDLLDVINIMEDSIYQVIRKEKNKSKEYAKLPAILDNIKNKVNTFMRDM